MPEEQNKKAAGGEVKRRTVEESFALLESMVEKLEDPATTLEESFQIYQEGMGILKEVGGTLDLLEKKMQVLTGNGETEEFT